MTPDLLHWDAEVSDWGWLMRTVRTAPFLLGAVAALALTVQAPVAAASRSAQAGHGVVNNAFALRAGECLTPIRCVVVGTGTSSDGVIEPIYGIESQGVENACDSDARTVDIAVQAYEVESSKVPTTSTAWRAALLGKANGGPYLEHWPDNPHYAIVVAGTATGRTTGDHVNTHNGDVIVTALDNAKRTYDFTSDASACSNLDVLVPQLGISVGDDSVALLDGIACPPGKARCYAVGQYGSPMEGAVVAVNTGSPIEATVAASYAVPVTTTLFAIACPSPSTCLAVGAGPDSEGVVVPIVDGVVGTADSDSNEGLESISCVSATLCFAAGGDTTSNEGSIVPIQIGSSVTLGTPVDVASSTALEGIACPTSASCYAVGERFFDASSDAVFVKVSVAHGVPTPGTAQSVSAHADLWAIDCLDAVTCDAAGTRSSSTDSGVVLGISNGSPGAMATVPGSSVIYGLACAETLVCDGVGVGTSSVGVIDELAPSVPTKSSLRTSVARPKTGEAVELTATIDPRVSTGTVAFLRSGSPIAGCAAVKVTAGVARCRTSFDKLGVSVVRASFSGDAVDRSSSSGLVVERVSA